MTMKLGDHIALERAKIRQLLEDWAGFRDAGLWDRLRATYTADATMAVSWFDGPASGFVDRCAANPVAAQHVLGSSQVDINGDRALADTRTVILLRVSLDGVACDIAAVGGFRDRLAREAGAWRIAQRVAVFEKDTAQPVIPGDTMPFDRDMLMRAPAAYRFCACLWAAQGVPVNMHLPAPGSPALAQLEAAGRAWLGGAAP